MLCKFLLNKVPQKCILGLLVSIFNVGDCETKILKLVVTNKVGLSVQRIERLGIPPPEIVHFDICYCLFSV